MSSDQVDALGAVFGPGKDTRVAGEALIRLTPEAAQEVSVAIPDGPSAFGLAVTALGLDHLDGRLRDVKCQAIAPVFPPEAPSLVGGFAAPVPPTEDYRIWFDPHFPLDEVIGGLKGCEEVASAEPNAWLLSFGESAGPTYHHDQWGLKKIHCPEAWKRSIGDQNVAVAVLDSGIDLDHPELTHLLRPGFTRVNFSPWEHPTGWVLEGNFAGAFSGAPQDEVGHGTHVAGIISSVPSCDGGVAGVTQGCELIPVRVMARGRETSTGRVRPFGTAADAAAGIRWATQQDAQVINMSYGTSLPVDVERRAIEEAARQGVVLVAAAGNAGNSLHMFPAAFPEVIAVTACAMDDQLWEHASFGSHVNLCAPGVEILSTAWGADRYAVASGTSAASPHVAGVAALVRSVQPDLTSDDVKRIIRETATPLVNNPTTGSKIGLVNAEAALSAASSNRSSA